MCAAGVENVADLYRSRIGSAADRSYILKTYVRYLARLHRADNSRIHFYRAGRIRRPSAPVALKDQVDYFSALMLFSSKSSPPSERLAAISER